MLDLINQALALPGLGWLVGALMVAGLVRGFSGFGSALIIMPVASSVLSPFAAIAFLTVVEFFGPLPNLRDALRKGSIREVGLLTLGVVVALPVGLTLLSQVSPEVFNWIVSCVVLVLLALLIAGWRYNGQLRPTSIVGIGCSGGFLAGLVGIPGPPVIMFYMASSQAISVIRANFLLYLFSVDVIMIVSFVLLGTLDIVAIVVALLMVLPYMAANVIGASLFNPNAERTFRLVAYAIIAASAVVGLPIWG
ncbi:MAG: sulfite exporter TauE/SafE family protein [Aliishimia sp.]